MLQRTKVLLVAIVLGLAVSPSASAQEDGTILEPKYAGPDFAVQGEYAGSIEDPNGSHKWGAQVIALGDGKFLMTAFMGGLPGDGWKRGDKRVDAKGKRDGSVANFSGDAWAATIDDGQMVVSNPTGDTMGALHKVHRKSATLGAKPPAGAIVLFDGSNADAFENGKLVMTKLLGANCSTKRKFGDHRLHIEFRTPFKPKARGQQRGNSGVYVQSRYEVQVLDSFGLKGRDNECGGIYSIAQPKVNMCLPPLTWQAYDIDFTAARYDDSGEKATNARITVRHNGVVIHDDLELKKGTPGREPEGPSQAGLYLQGHGNPVVYRNIWIVEK